MRLRLGFILAALLPILVTAANEAFAQSASFWSPWRPLSPDSATDILPDGQVSVATDSAGIWIAVWDVADAPHRFIAFSRSADYGASWTSRQPLYPGATTDGFWNDNADVATDGAGNWVVVWTNRGRYGTDFDIVVSRSADNGISWTQPQALNSDAMADTYWDYNPKIATDHSGNWVTVWNTRDRYGSDWDIAVSRSADNGASWTQTQALNSPAAMDFWDDRDPQVTSDRTGNWVAVWTNANSLCDFPIVLARSFNNGASWTAQQHLYTGQSCSTNGLSPKITTDTTGNWILAYETLGRTTWGDDRDIAFSRSSDYGQSWSDEQPLNPDPVNDSDEDYLGNLANDGAGQIVAVWVMENLPSESTNVVASRSMNNGATWSAPQSLTFSPFGTETHRSPIAITDAGTWLALWDTYSPNFPSQEIVISRDGIMYSALGDSYSSGVGAGDYLPGTDTPTNMCRRSRNAYGSQIRFLGLGLHQQEFLACNGARVYNVRTGGTPPDTAPQEASQLDTQYPLPQIPNSYPYIVDVPTDMTTISIGGNDLGFEYILKYCFKKRHCYDQQPWARQGDMRTLAQVIDDRLGIVADAAGSVYAEIKQRAPNSAIFVIGYPELFSNAPSCPLWGQLLRSSERDFIDTVANTLNEHLGAEAARQGVHYVDSIKRFKGHGACATKPSMWINGPQFPDLGSSFHPNKLGHHQLGGLVSSFINVLVNGGGSWPLLSTGLPANPPPTLNLLSPSPGQSVMTGAPSFGELHVEPAAPPICSTRSTFVGGQAIRVTGRGFAADQAVIVDLGTNDDNYTSELGTVAADSAGTLDAIVEIPTSAPTNEDALLEALGPGADGEALLLISEIKLSTSFASDADGDGIPDPCDNCPALADSDSTDSDGDGVGDPCDLCPLDPDDDLDGDGICADADVCELDAGNDADGDGLCESNDNCPLVVNPVQVDTDKDGAGDVCDSAPTDPGVITIPAEIPTLEVSTPPVTLTWTSAQESAGPATVYDVLRGSLNSFPVGTADACFASGVTLPSASEPEIPQPGTGFYYLVRGRNALGDGIYGYDGSGAVLVSFACP